MANWKALTWSEDHVTTGKSTARQVLTMLCLKSDDDFRVYRTQEEIAGLCELSPRRIYGWFSYLEQSGLITVIRRVRRNNSEAKPITLINHPDAPHWNGEPVDLDYRGHHYYPLAPDKLREAGIRWVSGIVEGATRPNQQRKPGDKTSGGPGDDSSGGPPDNSSGPGGDSSSPPRHSPGRQSTNQGIEDRPGGLAGKSEAKDPDPQPKKPQKQRPDTRGARFLDALVLPDRTKFGPRVIQQLHHHVDELLASGWTEQGLTAELTADTGPVDSWRKVARSRLTDLRPVSQQGQDTGSSTPSKPRSRNRLWCRDCDGQTITVDGQRARICSDDCPHAPSTADVAALKQELATPAEPEQPESHGATSAHTGAGADGASLPPEIEKVTGQLAGTLSLNNN